jgi:excinuclease ABC subunit A
VCEECDGKRYRPEVLEVPFRGRSIADALALSIEEAAELFQHQPKVAAVLGVLCEVGLGYRRGRSSARSCRHRSRR